MKFEEAIKEILEAKIGPPKNMNTKYYFELVYLGSDKKESFELTLSEAAKYIKSLTKDKNKQLIPADARLIKKYKTNVKVLEILKRM